MNRNKLRMILSASVLVLVLALAPAAFAQSSSVETYGGQAGEVAGIAASGDEGSPPPGGTPSSGTASSSSALPFTGLDVGLLAGGGLMLLLIGVAMARLTRPERDAEPS